MTLLVKNLEPECAKLNAVVSGSYRRSRDEFNLLFHTSWSINICILAHPREATQIPLLERAQTASSSITVLHYPCEAIPSASPNLSW